MGMAEQNNESKEEYDLYTEHIVPDKSRKFKKFIKKIIGTVGVAVLFGIIAGLIMIIVYRFANGYIGDDDKRETEDITLATREVAESTEDVTTPMEETEPVSVEHETQPVEEEETISDDVSEIVEGVRDFNSALKSIVADVQTSMTDITVVFKNSDYQASDSLDGLIVAADTNSYYILSSYISGIEDAELDVTYADQTGVSAEYVYGDTELGLAVIKTKIADGGNAKVAVLGNSDTVAMGDGIVAVGDIYGTGMGVNYGMITDIGSTILLTDAEYATIGTGVLAGEKSGGVICNLDGEIVGLITSGHNIGSDSLVRAYAVNSIYNTIENLVNAKGHAYIGIQGQSTTDKMKADYGLPKGVYVTAVEVNSPSYNAGIQTGDVITAVGDAKINDMSDYMEAITELADEKTVDITVKRRNKDEYKEIVFKAELGVQ